MGKQRKIAGKKRKLHANDGSKSGGADELPSMATAVAGPHRSKRLKMHDETQGGGRKLIVVLEDCSLEVGKVCGVKWDGCFKIRQLGERNYHVF